MNFSKGMKINVLAISLFMSLQLFGVENSTDIKAALTIKTIYSSDRGKPIDVYYWYPTKEGDYNFKFGNKKIFHSIKAVKDAKIAPGKHPVIILSHGGTKSSFTHTGWVASLLTKNGYIVVAPKPPMHSENKPNLAINELSYRPSDIVLALSSIKSMSLINANADLSRVYGVGFFLGGTSMLSLIGAKLDPKKYQVSCKSEEINIDCGWLKKNNVNLMDLDLGSIFKTKIENRFKSIVVINPELTEVFEGESLKSITRKVTVIDLLAERKLALKPAELISEIPELSLVNISSASVFSAFSICTEKGINILALDDNDIICHEVKEINRQENHEKIISEILFSLREKLN